MLVNQSVTYVGESDPSFFFVSLRLRVFVLNLCPYVFVSSCLCVESLKIALLRQNSIFNEITMLHSKT